MIRLETSRLYMRPFTVDDAEHIYLLNSDTDVIRYTADAPFESIEKAHEFIQVYDQYKKHKLGRFSVFQKSDDAYVGWCGLKLGLDKRVDLGYRFLKKAWGQGYATESAKCHLDYGFNTLNFKEIIARSLPENLASIRIIEKLGFKYEGEEFDHGNFVCLYSLSKSDYLASLDNESE